MTPDSSAGLRIAALYGATFARLGISMPFFPLWLVFLGLSPDQIGLISALPHVICVVATPLTVGLADRFAPASVLVVANLVAAAGFALMIPGPSVPLLVGLVVLTAVAQSPLVAVVDVLAIAVLKTRPRLQYGRLRAWGTVAFIATNVVGGVVAGWLPPPAIPAALGVAFLIAAAASLAAPRLPAVAPTVVAPSLSPVRIGRVLALVIAATGLIQASHSMLFAFGSISFEAAGIRAEWIGVLWAVGGIAEVILFTLLGSAVGPRFPAFLAIAVGGAVSTLRWVVMAFEPGVWWQVFAMALHGIGFGATHLGTIAAFARLAPEGGLARAQGVMVSVHALGIGLFMAASGPLYGAWGGAAFAAMVPLSVAGVVVVGLAWRLQPQSAGDDGKARLPS